MLLLQRPLALNCPQRRKETRAENVLKLDRNITESTARYLVAVLIYCALFRRALAPHDKCKKFRDYDRLQELMFEALHYFAVLACQGQVNRHDTLGARCVCEGQRCSSSFGSRLLGIGFERTS